MSLYATDHAQPEEWELDPHAGPLWADVGAFLAGGVPEPEQPVCLRRSDGHALFYAGKVNVLFGDPESGKTWVALAAVAEALADGRRAAVVDVDHNGMREIVTRLLTLGAPREALGDDGRFRLYEPEDGAELVTVVAQVQLWRPAVAVVDSLGEVLPMLGLSSNSPDDYTSAHRRVLTALATAGAAVVAIDHMPKSDDARAHGQTGTMAKRRAVNGASIRVTIREPFAPGRGGAAGLTIHKDRPGGLRASCPEGKQQPAGVFVMTPELDGSTSWRVTAPSPGDVSVAPSGDRLADDVAELDALDPPPKSVRDVKQRMHWGDARAQEAWRAFKIVQGREVPS